MLVVVGGERVRHGEGANENQKTVGSGMSRRKRNWALVASSGRSRAVTELAPSSLSISHTAHLCHIPIFQLGLANNGPEGNREMTESQVLILV